MKMNRPPTPTTRPQSILPDDWVLIRCRSSRKEELIHLTDKPSPIPYASSVTASSLLGRLLVGRSTGDIVPFHAAHGRLQLEIVDSGRFESPSRFRSDSEAAAL